MNDRDRVMMNIAVHTSGSIHDKMERLKGGWTMRFRFGKPVAQFIPEEMAKAIDMPLVNGDIIRCFTNPNHEWGISELVERRGYAGWLLREIGGDRTCDMQNESVDVLRFMPPALLYTGVKHKIYKWASRSVFSERHGGDYLKKCGGVEFDGDELIIWCRPHVLALEKTVDGERVYAQPKRFTLKWDKRIRLRDIVSAMREQGFGEDFEYGPNEPKEGMGGFAKITRDDLMGVLQR